MFNGIVKSKLLVFSVLSKGKGKEFQFQVPLDDLKNFQKGDSIAINGVCQTVAEISYKKNTLTSFSSEETLALTNLNFLKEGDYVNMEPPLTLNDFVSGHLIQGHVEGMAKLLALRKGSSSHICTFKILNPNLMSFLIPKGSIALDGVSLTIYEVDSKNFLFQVMIIPQTWEKTIFHSYQLNAYVNIETDLIARYLFFSFNKKQQSFLNKDLSSQIQDEML